MSNYIAVVKCDRIQEDGAKKRVSAQYLCDALSVTEAEVIVTENVRPYISGDFIVSSVKTSKISEVMGDGTCGRFWLAKVVFITIDEKTAAEKRTVSQVLIGAENFATAVDYFNEGMKGTMADIEVVSLAETPIKEFYPAKL